MVRSGLVRGRGFGLWLSALALAGACDTFSDSSGGTYGFPGPSFGSGGSSAGGTIGFTGGGKGFAGTTGKMLCPAAGSGGSTIILDAGADVSSGGSPTEGGAPGASGQGGMGGETSGPGGEGGIGGESGMAGSGDAAGAAGETSTAPCSREPEVGSCAQEGLVCMFSDDPVNVSCRRTWTCFNGLWSSSVPCTEEQQTACPATPPVINSSCPVPVSCAYPEGSACDCVRCGTGNCWMCSTPPILPPGCPQQPPLGGTPCSVTPIECVYGECYSTQLPVTAVCCDGSWLLRDDPCPILL